MTWPYYYFPRSRKRKKNAVILEGQHCYGLQMLKAAGRLGGLSFHRYFSNNILEKFGSSKIFQEIILKRYLFFSNVYIIIYVVKDISLKNINHILVSFTKRWPRPKKNVWHFDHFSGKSGATLLIVYMQITVLSHLIVKFTNNTNSILNAPAPCSTFLPGSHP